MNIVLLHTLFGAKIATNVEEMNADKLAGWYEADDTKVDEEPKPKAKSKKVEEVKVEEVKVEEETPSFLS